MTLVRSAAYDEPCMPFVTLEPGGIKVEVKRKEILLRALQRHHIPIGSTCGGKGLCASCKVEVLESPKSLSKVKELEQDLADRNNLQNNERISCQAKVLDDLKITTAYWDQEALEHAVKG